VLVSEARLRSTSSASEVAAWLHGRLAWEQRLAVLEGPARGPLPVGSAGASVLHLHQVHKSYGHQVALDGVTLELSAGEIVGLLGPNGAGKTTLVSIVCGLLRADAGTVRVAGVDVGTDPHSARTLLGVAPQHTGVYEVLTVRENLAFFGELGGLRRRLLATRIDQLSVALRLAPLLGRPANTLSGGEKRRLHTAIAFLHAPPLLLLDEPTVGADVETRMALLDVVRAAAADGAAVLYSTHYLPEVEALDASAAILVRGRVVARGPVQELVARFGVATAQLTFDGPAPRNIPGAIVTGDGTRLRIDDPDPANAAASAIRQLGPETSQLRAIEVVHPSLDSVFLSLTGHRYDDHDEDVPAA
jgi:ABC-2 type transport system ATP-binding protein